MDFSVMTEATETTMLYFLLPAILAILMSKYSNKVHTKTKRESFTPYFALCATWLEKLSEKLKFLFSGINK